MVFSSEDGTKLNRRIEFGYRKLNSVIEVGILWLTNPGPVYNDVVLVLHFYATSDFSFPSSMASSASLVPNFSV